jgi:hypothetical protein
MLYGASTRLTASPMAGKRVLLPSPDPLDTGSQDHESVILEDLELPEDIASEPDDLSEDEKSTPDKEAKSEAPVKKKPATADKAGTKTGSKPTIKVNDKPKARQENKEAKETKVVTKASTNCYYKDFTMSRFSRNNDTHASFSNPNNYPTLEAEDEQDLEDFEDVEESMGDQDIYSFDDINAFDDTEMSEDDDMDEDELTDDEIDAMSDELEAMDNELSAAEQAAEDDGYDASDEDLDDDFEVSAGDEDYDEVDLDDEESSDDVTEEELDRLLSTPVFASDSVSEEELDELMDNTELSAKVACSYGEMSAAVSDEDEEEPEETEDEEPEETEDEEPEEETEDEEPEEETEDEEEDKGGEEESEDDEEYEDEGGEEESEDDEEASYESMASDDDEMTDQISEIDLSEATEIEETDEVAVAHVTSSTGQRYWQLMCNDIPLAILRPGQLKGPLKAVANDRLDNTDFNTALVNTIRAAGTDAIHVASSMGFTGIKLPDVVMPSIDHAVEARVIEDQRLNMKGWKRDLKITASAINRGFYSNAANPLAINLTKVLASIGVGNAASIVKSALAEAFDPFVDQLLAKTLEFRANPPEAQRAIASAIGQMQMLSSDDEDGENADMMAYDGGESAPDDLAAMMEESSSRHSTTANTQQPSGRVLSVEEIRELFRS